MNKLLFISNILFLFSLLVSYGDNAEAPTLLTKNVEGATSEEIESEEIEILLSYNQHELNCFTEKMLRLLSFYLINLFRLLTMVNEQHSKKELINLKSVVHLIETHSYYYSRCLLISFDRLEDIDHYINKYVLHSLVDQAECEENREILPKIEVTLTNYELIIKHVESITIFLQIILKKNLEENLKISVIALIEQKDLILVNFTQIQSALKKLDSKKLKRIFSKKALEIEGFSFSITEMFPETRNRNELITNRNKNKKISEKYIKLVQEGKESSMEKCDRVFARNYIRYNNNDGLEIETIFWYEILITQSIKILGYIFDNVSIFDSASSDLRNQILDFESKILFIIETRSTELDISQQKSTHTRHQINELLKFNEIKNLNLKIICKKKALYKSDILNILKSQYKFF